MFWCHAVVFWAILLVLYCPQLDVLSLFWGYFLLTAALGLCLVSEVVYNTEVIMRASQVSSFGKERGDHSDSEPIWEVWGFWARVKERRYRFCAHKAVLQNQVPRILILLKPEQINVLLPKPVLPHLEFCPLSGLVCWALLVPLKREHEAWKDQLEVINFEALVMKFCLILHQKWISFRWLSSFPVHLIWGHR